MSPEFKSLKIFKNLFSPTRCLDPASALWPRGVQVTWRQIQTAAWRLMSRPSPLPRLSPCMLLTLRVPHLDPTAWDHVRLILLKKNWFWHLLKWYQLRCQMISVLYLGSALNTGTIRDLTPRSGLGAGGWSVDIRHRGVLWLNKALGEGQAEVLHSKGGGENVFSCGGWGILSQLTWQESC